MEGKQIFTFLVKFLTNFKVPACEEEKESPLANSKTSVQGSSGAGRGD